MTAQSVRRLAHVASALIALVTLVAIVAAAKIGGGITLDSTVVLAFLVYGVVGAVITFRRPGIPLGWLFQAVGLVAALGAVITRPDLVSQGGSGMVDTVPPWPQVASLAFLSCFWMVLVSLSTTFTVLLFPQPPRTRGGRALLAVAAVALIVLVLTTTTARYLALNPDFTVYAPNPLWIGIPWEIWRIGSPVFDVAVGVLLACGLIRVVGMVRDYRRSDGIERQQLRWLAWAAVLFVPLNLVSGTIADGLPVLGAVVTDLSFALIPIACAVAVLRYRLYDLGRLVSRTVAYSIVTLVVLATYALLVTSMTNLVPGKNSALPVAIATLASAAAFRPVLRRVQRWVDRRFDRTRYDVQRTIDGFASGLRSGDDPTAAAEDLVDVVDRCVAPSSVALWVREGQR